VCPGSRPTVTVPGGELGTYLPPWDFLNRNYDARVIWVSRYRGFLWLLSLALEWQAEIHFDKPFHQLGWSCNGALADDDTPIANVIIRPYCSCVLNLKPPMLLESRDELQWD